MNLLKTFTLTAGTALSLMSIVAFAERRTYTCEFEPIRVQDGRGGTYEIGVMLTGDLPNGERPRLKFEFDPEAPLNDKSNNLKILEMRVPVQRAPLNTAHGWSDFHYSEKQNCIVQDSKARNEFHEIEESSVYFERHFYGINYNVIGGGCTGRNKSVLERVHMFWETAHPGEVRRTTFDPEKGGRIRFQTKSSILTSSGTKLEYSNGVYRCTPEK